MRLKDWKHSEDELRPYAERIVEEHRAARDILTPLVAQSGGDWDDFRRETSGLPEIRWPRLWEHVYEEITLRFAAEAEEKRKAALARTPFAFPPESLADSISTVPPDTRAMLRAMSRASTTDIRATAARR
jgi:hypothetical protein